MATTFYGDPDAPSARHSYNKRFRDSTHLLPSPGQYKLANRYHPLYLSLPVLIITPLLMLAAGLGLEVAIAISERNGGFAVPARNIFSVVSTQFLLSFFPTIIVFPLGLVWRQLDWYIRWYQPYVTLSRGNAKAEESLLLDYVALGPLSLLYGLRFGHRLIYWSALTALATYIFQPLAGSVFQLQQRPQTESDTVTITKSIGLIQDFDQLNAFAASAGYVEAAVFNNLSDPPFTSFQNGAGWATAEFVFPTYSGFNGSMTVNTTGIQTTANCDNPTSTPTITQNGVNFTINAVSKQGCNGSIPFDPTISPQQYGVFNLPGCGPNGNLNITQQAVMFWFFNTKPDNSQEARAVFCSPSIKAFDVTASADIATGSLTGVNSLNTYTAPNNVTGDPLDSQPFNAVVFEPSLNPFIQARATATNNGVPGAIFQSASQENGGVQTAFDLANGFLDITTDVYTRHLALVAKSVYFVGQNSTAPAVKTSFVPRLWIYPLPAHPMAIVMILVGIGGLVITLLNYRQRRGLLLATPPGSIASAVALTAHSGFGDLLLPYDSEEDIERKLRGYRFRLDRRTGAILAEDYDEEAETRRQSVKDEQLASLLGSSESRTYTSTYPPSNGTTSSPPMTASLQPRVKSPPPTTEQ